MCIPKRGSALCLHMSDGIKQPSDATINTKNMINVILNYCTQITRNLWEPGDDMYRSTNCVAKYDLCLIVLVTWTTFICDYYWAGIESIFALR